MKKFVIGLVAAKLLFLSALFSITFSACQTAQLSQKTETAPTATITPNDNINRPTSQPYKGDLSIFEGEERAKDLQIDRVMDILKISEGKWVADIGAGSGWFTVRAAKRVGDKGKVFAVEINEDAIKYINDRAKRENFSNIQTVLGTADNPNLAENSIDAVMILKTYHEIAEPLKLMANLRKDLKKDALVGIIDRNGNGEDHGLNKDAVISEVEKVGFKLDNQYDFVKGNGVEYFLVFKVK